MSRIRQSVLIDHKVAMLRRFGVTRPRLAITQDPEGDLTVVFSDLEGKRGLHTFTKDVYTVGRWVEQLTREFGDVEVDAIELAKRPAA